MEVIKQMTSHGQT